MSSQKGLGCTSVVKNQKLCIPEYKYYGEHEPVTVKIIAVKYHNHKVACNTMYCLYMCHVIIKMYSYS